MDWSLIQSLPAGGEMNWKPINAITHRTTKRPTKEMFTVKDWAKHYNINHRLAAFDITSGVENGTLKRVLRIGRTFYYQVTKHGPQKTHTPR